MTGKLTLDSETGLKKDALNFTFANNELVIDTEGDDNEQSLTLEEAKLLLVWLRLMLGES